MLISFVLVCNDIEGQINNTLKSILDQSDDDYEVILIANKMLEEYKELDTYREYFWNIDKVKVVVNSAIQGEAVCWNTAIDLAEGKYVKFINQGDIVDKDYIKQLKIKLKDFNIEEIDLIEYDLKLTGYAEGTLQSYLEKNKVYDLSKEYEPYAYIGPALINKLFKTQLLKEFGFKFKRFVRYDMFFIYKVLGQSSNYLFLKTDEPLESLFLEKVQYSVFDLINQWTHIFNYYRRIGKFKNLKDFLNYAYYKTLIHIWLRNVIQYDNKLLIKKAVNFAARKFEDKKDEFVKNNKIFLESKDKDFYDIANNFSSYIKDILKLAR